MGVETGAAEIALFRGHSPWGYCPRDTLPAGFLLLLPVVLAYSCISELLSQSERPDAGTRTAQRVATDADILSSQDTHSTFWVDHLGRKTPSPSLAIWKAIETPRLDLHRQSMPHYYRAA